MATSVADRMLPFLPRQMVVLLFHTFMHYQILQTRLVPRKKHNSILEVDGVFAGATLTYKEMLILDATLRRDRASTLPENNNTYYYPSVSGGFVFSKLLPNLKWLTYGKLRANYAEVGNNAPALSVINTYTIPPPFGTHTIYSVSNTRNNPNLKPELSKSYEVGWKHRCSIIV